MTQNSSTAIRERCKKSTFCEPVVHLGGGGLAEGPVVHFLILLLFCWPKYRYFFLNKPSLCSKRPNYANSHI